MPAAREAQQQPGGHPQRRGASQLQQVLSPLLLLGWQLQALRQQRRGRLLLRRQLGLRRAPQIWRRHETAQQNVRQKKHSLLLLLYQQALQLLPVAWRPLLLCALP